MGLLHLTAAREDEANYEIARIIREQSEFDARAERLGRVRGTADRPDIIVKRSGTSCVIIETEWIPARTLEDEVESRVGIETDAGVPSAVFGVRMPRGMRDADDMNRELRDAQYEYFIRTDDGRFPERGYLSGGMLDIIMAVRLTMTPRRNIERCVEEMSNSITRISDIIGELRDARLERMMNLVSEDVDGLDRQSWNMVSLILLNAGIFQEELSEHIDTPSLDDCATLGIITKDDVILAWRAIHRINYDPIFNNAIGILNTIPNEPAQHILEEVRKAVSVITSLHVQKSGDVYGSLYQRMLRDRKNAAAFYTRPESATLLASLVMSGGRYDSTARIKKLRIADFACGTGMLLTAAYNHIINHAGRSVERLHADIMGSVLYGYDIMPTAVHITASNLAGLFPNVVFPNSHIHTMNIGPSENTAYGYFLGSLDLISPLTRLVDVGEVEGGHGAESVAAATVPDDSLDYVVMNPPFARNTNHAGGRNSVSPAFAVFGIEPADQKAMSALNSKMFKGTCAHGNAGIASNFMAMANRALKPGGTMGLILPATMPTGVGWKKVRQLINTDYENVMLVMTVAKKYGDTFSADTNLHETMLIARKRMKTPKNKKSYNKRIKWAIIDKVPANRLEAVELAKQITSVRPARLETCMGGTSIVLGDTRVGEILDTRMDDDRWFVGRVSNMRLFQHVVLFVGWPNMTTLRDVADMGLLARDITENTHNKNGEPRGPFNMVQYNENSDGYPCLWDNKKDMQQSMVVGPTYVLEVKVDAAVGHAERVLDTATRVHINLQIDYRSQRLVAAYTEEPTLGGTAWPNVMLNDEKHEKAFMVWCNSIFGILVYWSVAGSQQAGRGRMSKTAFKSLPILDFTKLTDEQLDGINDIFDDMCHQRFQAINRLDTDEVRQELDERLCGMLGIAVDLDWLYRAIVREAQFVRTDLDAGPT